MRCDQFIGLSLAANEFLDSRKQICGCCKQAVALTMEQIGHYEGMFMDEYPLRRYKFIGGSADEFLQASPWSSGPMFFLGLRVYNLGRELIKVIQWAEQEIEEMSR